MSLRLQRIGLVVCMVAMLCATSVHSAPRLLPIVEAEYQVYDMRDPGNGAGPMWCHGSTCLARLGKDVFASGLELIADQKPPNNVRWTLFKLNDKEPQLLQTDSKGRQREPCPLGIFRDGRLLLTSNPTLTGTANRAGPAKPQLLIFDTKTPTAAPRVSMPEWAGGPTFSEHSYRGFAVDAPNQEALYLQNVGHDTSYWSFLDRDGRWSKCGTLKMPWGAEFEKPEAIRICYQNIALRNRAVYLLGVSDIIECVREWREYKLILHKGKTSDWVSRRLYFCWTPDVAIQPFGEWLKVADCEHCGQIRNLDLWLDRSGRAHILWLEQSIGDPRVRDKFFPGEPITYSLMYGIIDQGKMVQRTPLVVGGEKQESKEIPGYGRFQATPDDRLFVFYYIGGTESEGENRLIELYPDGTSSEPVRVPITYPLTSFFTATERGGSEPSATLDLLGRANAVKGIRYAKINLVGSVPAGTKLVEKNGVHYMMALRGTISPERITHEIGLCHNYLLGEPYSGDGLDHVPPSKLRFFEDEKELGPAHAGHAEIRQNGKGRFSHWKTLLYFSTSDGSDPRTNGRKYTWWIDE